MCDVSSTVGLTRCYKTEGFYAFIKDYERRKLSNFNFFYSPFYYIYVVEGKRNLLTAVKTY